MPAIFHRNDKVIVTDGVRRGSFGRVVRVMQADCNSGIATVFVILNGDADPIPFRSSLLMKETSTICLCLFSLRLLQSDC